MYIINL
jgi:hypothetical protein